MTCPALHAAVLAALAAVPPAAAQQASTTDVAAVADAAGRGLSGRGALNLAAGHGNAQANLAALALARHDAGAVDLHAVQQAWAPSDAARARDAHARIDGAAFTDSRGLLSVNQVAGGGNTQLNLFALGNTDIRLSIAPLPVLDDAALASVIGAPAVHGTAHPTGMRHAQLADDAFRGSQGVVQINQTAGTGNASMNAIVLQLPGSPP